MLTAFYVCTRSIFNITTAPVVDTLTQIERDSTTQWRTQAVQSAVEALVGWQTALSERPSSLDASELPVRIPWAKATSIAWRLTVLFLRHLYGLSYKAFRAHLQHTLQSHDVPT